MKQHYRPFLLSLSLPPLFSWDESVGDYYYFDSASGRSQWGHPLDDAYRSKVKEARALGSRRDKEGDAAAGGQTDMEVRPLSGKLVSERSYSQIALLPLVSRICFFCVCVLRPRSLP